MFSFFAMTNKPNHQIDPPASEMILNAFLYFYRTCHSSCLEAAQRRVFSNVGFACQISALLSLPSPSAKLVFFFLSFHAATALKAVVMFQASAKREKNNRNHPFGIKSKLDSQKMWSWCVSAVLQMPAFDYL